MSTANTTLLPFSFPANWASEWGQDIFGLFMDLDFQGIKQRFRWIMPGSFLMGSPETETEREANETQHEVTLTRGFWLADSACTQALWMAVMADNPSRFQEEVNNPVEKVSWTNVQQFIKKLNSRQSDLQARLPTEAEWEYACRAGTTTPFSFGDNITSEQVNYHAEYPYANGKKGLFRNQTVPVKSLLPNLWGLYEMHGNVWEWCQDWYDDYPAQAVIDPVGPKDGVIRVLRGGSGNFIGGNVRSAYRDRDVPDYRNADFSFRLALGQTSISGKPEPEVLRAAVGRTAVAV